MHVSLTEGLDPNWPFGTSILEMVFKVFKQKELLEDSIIIYRVQRAPERRVFNIDVGDMPSHLAMAFIEKVKNEIYQRRIPSMGDGQHYMDSSYFSMAPNADFFFPVTSSGRGTKVEPLPGGCLAMDTRVPLLDGRTLSLTELTEEYNSGKENWVYSCNPETGEIAPGIISWAGVTQKSANVLKITLDNGKVITATPDHKFPILNQGFIEARDLKVNDRLIPFNTRKEPLNSTAPKQFKQEYSLYNHSIVSIEYFTTPIEVGTLTIDKDEKYHNFHTFALEAGVFTKNSNLNEINDLLYFNNKMIRALRIPSSYLPTGPEDSPATLNDGRVGTALIQEFRFNQYCQRLQRLICSSLDLEFKAYLKWCGVNIDSGMFTLIFREPQNFAHYRQAELDQTKISTFSQLEGYSYFSKRWLMKRYLGLSEDELIENQKLWEEENPESEFTPEALSTRNLGITPGGIQSDMDMFSDAGLPSGMTAAPSFDEPTQKSPANSPEMENITDNQGQNNPQPSNI